MARQSKIYTVEQAKVARLAMVKGYVRELGKLGAAGLASMIGPVIKNEAKKALVAAPIQEVGSRVRNWWNGEETQGSFVGNTARRAKSNLVAAPTNALIQGRTMEQLADPRLTTKDIAKGTAWGEGMYTGLNAVGLV